MPIPTKATVVRPKTNTRPTSDSVPSIRNRLDRDSEQQQKTASKAESPSDASNASSNLSQTRVTPRPPTNNASSPVKPTRSATTTMVPPKPAVSLTATSSRTTSTSSIPSHSLPKVQMRNLTSNASSGTKLSSHSRVGSISTTTNTKIQPPQIARLKLPSSMQPISKPARTQKENGTISAPSTNPVGNKTDLQPSASRLQDELYQLQLLHMVSRQNLVQYERSIEQNISKKKAKLRLQQDQILELESANRQALSIEALDQWIRARQEVTPGIAIQQFSSAIVELDKLGQDSELQTSLEAFDKWLSDIMLIREERKSAVIASDKLKFVRSLGYVWQERMNELQQTLRTVVETLRGLQVVPDDDSGIGILASRQFRFANTILEEVETAMIIEKAIIQEESAWEKEQLRVAMDKLADTKSNVVTPAVTYMGVWTQESVLLLPRPILH